MRSSHSAAGSRATSVALELDSVTKRYSGGTTIGPISFTAERGTFVSLLGPSGCGKTTLLRAIAGFEAISHGSIKLHGTDVSGLPAHKRNVGLVFQNYSLFPHLSVFGNVAFGLKLRRVPAGDIATRVRAALAAVELAGVEDRLPAELSGGQQQRVAIARSMVLDPDILLLDEPLSNLDLKLRVQMRQELRSLQRRLGTTFVYVTHDQTEALAMSDQIIVLSNGRLVQAGTPQDIYQRPVSRFVADFIGGANLVRATVVSGGSSPLARVGDAEPFAFQPHAELQAGAACWIAVRPEALLVSDTDAVHFRGTIAASTFLGDRTEVEVSLPGGSTVRAYTQHAAAAGTAISLSVASAAAPVSVEE